MDVSNAVGATLQKQFPIIPSFVYGRELAYEMVWHQANTVKVTLVCRGVVTAHPNTQEAGYSRAQIQNIVNSLVPNQELLDVQVELALARIEHEGPPDIEPVPVTPLASELPS